MPATGRLRRRLIVLLGVAALTAIAVNLLPTVYAWWVGPWRQGVTLHIKLVGSDGEPVPYALVRVFLLTDHGPVLLATSGTYRSGEALVHVFVPRIGVGSLWVMKPYVVEVGGERISTYRFVETSKPIYASVNMEVFAVSLSPKWRAAGVRVFSIDPTYMRWPEDSVTVTVKLQRIPAVNSSGHEVRKVKPGIINEVSWWEYTPILKYATWDGIAAWYVLNIGAKIEVESKTQVCAAGTDSCTPWESAGSTQVTVNRGLGNPGKPGYISGELVRTLLAQLKYIDYWWCDAFAGVCEETIYAADTQQDFPKYEYLDESWDGHLPSSPYYAEFYTKAGVASKLPVYGGYHWDLSVSVSLGAGVSGPSISLGVTLARVRNPQLILYIIGDPSYGRVFKAVSAHGPDPGSFVVTYSNWVG